jgi:hypothetical protein
MSSLPWPELYENQMQKITQKTNNFKQVQSRQLIKPTNGKFSGDHPSFQNHRKYQSRSWLGFDALTVQTNERTNKQKSPNSFQNKNRPTKKERKKE